ncbi:hypothetical protein P171DRAFT_435601 [Karstenula rhodostoma CBS 690.94]|uniref:Uncharacterized protein n=1 Tax=Karstenula rhodostoma CBS 690.94 TaxID=1392251 RepID=A0A9P4PB14_9PLEO|nr:hypothetical protein P171DRAFT_435601 [Karstenula rhodostoma CBS 690.94]
MSFEWRYILPTGSIILLSLGSIRSIHLFPETVKPITVEPKTVKPKTVKPKTVTRKPSTYQLAITTPETSLTANLMSTKTQTSPKPPLQKTRVSMYIKLLPCPLPPPPPNPYAFLLEKAPVIDSQTNTTVSPKLGRFSVPRCPFPDRWLWCDRWLRVEWWLWWLWLERRRAGCGATGTAWLG